MKTPITNKLQKVKVGEIMYSFLTDESLPMKYYKELSSLRTLVEKVGSLKVIKTSMRPGRPNNLMVSNERTGVYFYKNVKTCILKKYNGIISPELVIEYSNIPSIYTNIYSYIDWIESNIEPKNNVKCQDHLPYQISWCFDDSIYCFNFCKGFIFSHSHCPSMQASAIWCPFWSQSSHAFYKLTPLPCYIPLSSRELSLHLLSQPSQFIQRQLSVTMVIRTTIQR